MYRPSNVPSICRLDPCSRRDLVTRTCVITAICDEARRAASVPPCPPGVPSRGEQIPEDIEAGGAHITATTTR